MASDDELRVEEDIRLVVVNRRVFRDQGVLLYVMLHYQFLYEMGSAPVGMFAHINCMGGTLGHRSFGNTEM